MSNLAELQALTDRLEQAETRLARFFNMAPNLFAIAGADGYFRRVNRAWTQILGYGQEEVLSRPWTDFVHPEDLEKTKAESQAMRQGRISAGFINRYRHKQGHYVALRWCAPEFDADGYSYAIAIPLPQSCIDCKLVAHE